MKIIIVSLLALTAACTSIKGFIDSGKAHQKMAQQLPSHTYDIPLSTLKEQLIEFFKMDHESPLIVLPSKGNPADDMRYSYQDHLEIDEAIGKNGYTYKGKLYLEEVDVDLMGILRGSSQSVNKLKSQIHTGPYNIVEDTPNKFVIIKGGFIYSGEKLQGDKTQLTARGLNEVKYESSSWRLDWGDIFNKKLGLYLDKGPVSMEESMKTSKRDALRELSLLHFLDKDTFLKWEKQASASL